jgi:hypothetical protein
VAEAEAPPPHEQRTERTEGSPARAPRRPEPAFAGEEPYAAAAASVTKVVEGAEEIEEQGEGGVPKRARRRTATSEPRLERIVVRGQAEAEAATVVVPDDSGQPARKGWWQRKLGSE